MASLKTIRKRIGSVKSTQQITRAMKMVAAAKLRRAQEAAQSARPYAELLVEMLRGVAANAGDVAHPLLVGRDAEKVIDLIIVTSDRGLCGGYNANIIRRAEAFVREHCDITVRLRIVGNKGYLHLRKRPVNIAAYYTHFPAGPQRVFATGLAANVTTDFTAGLTDAVYILYGKFRSALSQVPTVERLLPVRGDEAAGTEGAGTQPAAEGAGARAAADAGAKAAEGGASDFIYEPDATVLLDRLLRQYVVTLIHQAFLESNASEHGARMTAMDSASRNASDMIDRLTLAMNRARQAAITTELMEIVGGAEALAG